MGTEHDVVTIALQKENLDSSLFRLKRGTLLRLNPDVSLLGKEIILYTNYPNDEKEGFIRINNRILNWYSKYGKQITSPKNQCVHVVDIDVYAEIKVNISGTFHFFFTEKGSNINQPNGSLYIQVEPTLYVGPPGAQKKIPLDSIRCQSVISKCLGSIDTWESKLRVTKESGYNMVHFTPIQELGVSHSAYSLQDQLKVNSSFATNGKVSFEDVHKVVTKLRQEWGIASICDVVLNHTANESNWLIVNPESTYSCYTCPYLRPAFLLDAVLLKAGTDIEEGLLEQLGVPKVIEQECHLDALRDQLKANYLPKANIHELFQCHLSKIVNEFDQMVRANLPPGKKMYCPDRNKEIQLIQDLEYRRLKSSIDMQLALEIFNTFHADCFDEESRIRKCTDIFRQHIQSLNDMVATEIWEYLHYAVENCLAGVRYERIQVDGPRIKVISEKHPIFMQYFTHLVVEKRTLTEIEERMYGADGKFLMAHNGWVMGSNNPLNGFAEKQSTNGNVYLKRELISWGDSVKLRYGNKPEDSPYLWDHMRKYVETTAKIFDGVRLDNCHSTPLHVAEYLLDAARKVNPNLYVVAELFTNSDATDNIFVNRLGITSLIREAQSAWDSHEEGRLVYRYGGEPVGAFQMSQNRHLAPNIAHALFMDLTHDNPSPVEKRSVFDLLPSAALVSMACCATGSNRGYDELVPHHIHVVDETREYQEWEKSVLPNTGIIAGKRALNLLHGQLAEEGFNQVYVDQIDPNIVAVTRHSPKTHESIILVAHTAFFYPDPNAGPTHVRPLRFEGCLDEIVLEAEILNKGRKPFDRPLPFKKSDKYINGLDQFQLHIREHISLSESNIFSKEPVIEGNMTQLNFQNLRPGSIVAIRVSLNPITRQKFEKLQGIVTALQKQVGPIHAELESIITNLNLVDVNRTLFMCDQEERDMGLGGAAYHIPGYGPVVYCGLQGLVSILTDIAPKNDLGHPLCDNLRNGDWMLDYISQRLRRFQDCKKLAKWFRLTFESLRGIPRYLIPCYFDAIVNGVYSIVVEHSYSLMPEFISKGSNFAQSLGLATIQFLSICKTANLPKLSPNINPPSPPEQCVTLSAGLPHFATGYLRCWGRDTFIALRGCLFLTGRFNEARYIIIGFAECLRHGLIPNLLDGGSSPRYNCRDAVWWWFHCIKQFVNEAPKGKEILRDKVSRIFPTDNSSHCSPGEHDQFLYDTMQEALNVHFQGLQYRERNAGYEIDAHMKDKGFNNQIGINPDTGFVFGGNAANCGTWMDKMGSSEKANNRGRPITPRDGSAVELIGLQVSALKFMEQLSREGLIPHKSVERYGKNGEKTTWTYGEWVDRITENFEHFFFVTKEERAPLANKKLIYKDSLGATQKWTDYQLRCNFPITMVIAPELFNPFNAWQALEVAKKHLLGPLGIKTLDPNDWNYRGNYDNSNDSSDATVAHGANYHQGPEWVWPIGYYLRARLIFAKKCGFLSETIAETWQILQAHLKEIKSSHWRGLPELTNENGDFCRDSCRTQAWSVATILEVLYDLHHIGGDLSN